MPLTYVKLVAGVSDKAASLVQKGARLYLCESIDRAQWKPRLIQRGTPKMQVNQAGRLLELQLG